VLIDRFFNYINGFQWFPFIFVSPSLYAVGDCAEQIYFSLLKARREKKKVIILRPYYIPFFLQYRLCNKELFNVQSEYLNYKFRIIIEHCFKVVFSLIYIPLRLLSIGKKYFLGKMLPDEYNFPMVGINTLWQHDDRQIKLSWKSVRSFNWKKQFRDPISVFLDEKKSEIARKLLLKLGISKGEWFVCVHVREGGFRQDTLRRSYRNSDIHNYLPAIEEIVNRGGWVVRMGDSTMKPLPRMDQVVDYPFTPYKGALMDLYLIKECSLYIGCQSGIYDAAVLFNKNILYTNMYCWLFGYPLRFGDLGIIKHIYSKQKKRFLSVKEQFVDFLDFQNPLNDVSNEYEMFENKPEEIKQLVVEFFEKHPGVEHSELQREANGLRIQYSYKLFASKDMPAGQNIMDLPLRQQYCIASRIVDSMGALGQNYLESNWENDCMNQ